MRSPDGGIASATRPRRWGGGSSAFGGDRFQLSSSGRCGGDRARNRWLAALAGRLGVACVATGDVHAHDPARVALQDALVAVRLRATLEETEPARRGNAASVMLPDEEVATRFVDHPEAVAESGRLAERLRFDLTSDLEYRYPGSEDPDADRRLAEVCGLRLDERYPGGSERAEAERRLEEELRVIRSLRLSGFSCSIASCSSWRGRWRARCAVPTRRGCCSARARARVQRQLDRAT